jgi:hypothetical protein
MCCVDTLEGKLAEAMYFWAQDDNTGESDEAAAWKRVALAAEVTTSEWWEMRQPLRTRRTKQREKREASCYR